MGLRSRSDETNGRKTNEMKYSAFQSVALYMRTARLGSEERRTQSVCSQRGETLLGVLSLKDRMSQSCLRCNVLKCGQQNSRLSDGIMALLLVGYPGGSIVRSAQGCFEKRTSISHHFRFITEACSLVGLELYEELVQG